MWEKNVGPKNVRSKNNHKKVWVKKFSKEISGQKKFWVKRVLIRKMWVKKNLDPKYFGLKNMLGPKYLG